MLTLPTWALWGMMLASFFGGFLLLQQLKAIGWRMI